MPTLSLYAHARDTDATPLTMADWPTLAAELTTRRVRDDRDGPAIVLGEVTGTRSAANVATLAAIGADFDHVTPARMSEILADCRDFAHFAYTTHRHTPDAPRWRVIFPLARPIVRPRVDRQDHALHAGLAAVLPEIDPACKDASRLYYLPSCPPGTERYHATVVHFPDDVPYLDAADLLDDAAADAHATRTRGSGRDPRDAHADTVRRIIHARKGTYPPALVAMAKGEPFAPPGQRDEAIARATWALAGLDNDLPDDAIAFLVVDSLADMPDCDKTPDDVVRAYAGALTKRTEYQRERVQAAQAEHLNATPYNARDLARIAAAQGCGVDDLQHRWIVSTDGTDWLLNHRGEYDGPYTRGGEHAAHRVLGRAPVRLVDVDATTGAAKIRKYAEVLRDHATVLTDEEYDLRLDRTRLIVDGDGDYEFRIAPTHRRTIVPHFNDAIDGWISVAFGDRADKVRDWLAVAPDLDRPLCAMYVQGAPRAGKTLLATGLARLWTDDGPTPFEACLGNFNEGILRCPLLFADEQLPQPHGVDATAVLRSVVSHRIHTITRKYRQPARLTGCLRIILAANHPNLLQSRSVFTVDDLHAVGERILHVVVPSTAADYLDALPPGTAERWACDGIAAHALALAESRQVPDTGRRFAVEGDVGEMHLLQLFANPITSSVAELIYRIDTAERPIRQAARVGGRLLLPVDGLADLWPLLKHSKYKQPTTQQIASALRLLATPVTHEGRSMWAVDKPKIDFWLARNHIGVTPTTTTKDQHDDR